MIKQLILCADDYAADAYVSEGILQLATLKKINAISALVNFPFWNEASVALNDLQSHCYLGLHLNVTEGLALSQAWQVQYGPCFNGLASLITKGVLRQLDPAVIKAEIHAQLKTFTKATGLLPDFIDGHQHVHQLPFIREVLLSVYREDKLTAFLRQTSNGWQDFFSTTAFPKQQLIALLGGISFKHRLKKEGISTNSSFAGIYRFKMARQYGDYFKTFLANSLEGGIIMCHPGLPSKNTADPLQHSRPYEFQYFMSEQFEVDRQNHQVQLKQKGMPIL